jgi:hypothetical protein
MLDLQGNENRGQILNKHMDILQAYPQYRSMFLAEGKNLAKNTWIFKRINADLILANPLKEFHMPGW